MVIWTQRWPSRWRQEGGYISEMELTGPAGKGDGEGKEKDIIKDGN